MALFGFGFVRPQTGETYWLDAECECRNHVALAEFDVNKARNR